MALVRSVWTLLLAVALLVSGYSIFTTVLSLQATHYGFSDWTVGVVLGATSLGLIISTFYSPKLIRRIGHIRGFAAAAAVIAASILIHTISKDPIIWFLARFIVGLCSCMVFMAIESWLNALASKEDRGRLFGAYMAVYMISSGVAPLWLVFVSPYTPVLLIIASVLFTLCLVPVALTPVSQPKAIAEVSLDLKSIWRNSPLGVVGTLAAGIALTVVYYLAPVYAIHVGMSEAQVGLFLMALIAGGGLLQWPLGHVSDYIDRRVVLIAVCFVGAGLLYWMTYFPVFDWKLAALSAVVGGCLLSIYPLSIAHSNDHARSEDALNISRSLLLVYGVGAVIGPFVTGAVMDLVGTEHMLETMAVFLIIPGVYGLYRVTRRRTVPNDQQHDYVPMVQTTPVELELHPQLTEPSKP